MELLNIVSSYMNVFFFVCRILMDTLRQQKKMVM